MRGRYVNNDFNEYFLNINLKELTTDQSPSIHGSLETFINPANHMNTIYSLSHTVCNVAHMALLTLIILTILLYIHVIKRMDLLMNDFILTREQKA